MHLFFTGLFGLFMPRTLQISLESQELAVPRTETFSEWRIIMGLFSNNYSKSGTGRRFVSCQFIDADRISAVPSWNACRGLNIKLADSSSLLYSWRYACWTFAVLYVRRNISQSARRSGKMSGKLQTRIKTKLAAINSSRHCILPADWILCIYAYDVLACTNPSKRWHHRALLIRYYYVYYVFLCILAAACTISTVHQTNSKKLHSVSSALLCQNTWLRNPLCFVLGDCCFISSMVCCSAAAHRFLVYCIYGKFFAVQHT